MKVKNIGNSSILLMYDWKQQALGNNVEVFINPGEILNVDLSEDEIKKIDNIEILNKKEKKEILTKKTTATVKKAKNKWQ